MRSWFAGALALTASAGAIAAAQDLFNGNAWGATATPTASTTSRSSAASWSRVTSASSPRTVLSYLLVRPGDPFDEERIGLSVRALGATGLFADIQIETRGTDLVIRVLENPIINRIMFEGNSAVTTETPRGGDRGRATADLHARRASSRTCSGFSKSIAAPGVSPRR